MLASPFAFFRGAAFIMASDLSQTPASRLTVQLCGDAHLMNFGVFATPERRMVFSINDFDETLPGPFEWDVKRLAASFAVAGRGLGLDGSHRRSATASVARAYREAIGEFAAMRTMDIWYAQLEAQEILDRLGSFGTKAQLQQATRNLGKAQARDNLKAFEKLTREVDGDRRFVSDPPLVVPIEELLPPEAQERFGEAVRVTLRSYRRSLLWDRRKLLERFEYHHTARKVVGVGSVGTRAWIVLLTGRDVDDPLILQLKEATTSVLEPFLGKSEFANQGQRVVEGQRFLQTASDAMLGWDRVSGIDGVERDFYVRQLWDSKGSAQVETMDHKALAFYGEVCGWTLARAHARSGDPVAIAAYLDGGDSFDVAMTSFAEAYAEQNERDYAALQGAVKGGRIVARTGI